MFHRLTTFCRNNPFTTVGAVFSLPTSPTLIAPSKDIYFFFGGWHLLFSIYMYVFTHHCKCPRRTSSLTLPPSPQDPRHPKVSNRLRSESVEMQITDACRAARAQQDSFSRSQCSPKGTLSQAYSVLSPLRAGPSKAWATYGTITRCAFLALTDCLLLIASVFLLDLEPP